MNHQYPLCRVSGCGHVRSWPSRRAAIEGLATMPPEPVEGHICPCHGVAASFECDYSRQEWDNPQGAPME